MPSTRGEEREGGEIPLSLFEGGKGNMQSNLYQIKKKRGELPPTSSLRGGEEIYILFLFSNESTSEKGGKGDLSLFYLA